MIRILSILTLIFLGTWIIRDYAHSIYWLRNIDLYSLDRGVMIFRANAPKLSSQKSTEDPLSKTDPSGQLVFVNSKKGGLYKEVFPDEVIDIQVIVAQGTSKKEELFGHSFFRLRLCGDKQICRSQVRDLSFSFRARGYDPGLLGAIKAMTYTYEAIFEAENFEIMQSRNLSTGRDLMLFTLPLNREDKISFASHLLEASDQFIFGKWNLFYRSCNYFMQKFILENYPRKLPKPERISYWGNSPLELLNILINGMGIRSADLIYADNFQELHENPL